MRIIIDETTTTEAPKTTTTEHHSLDEGIFDKFKNVSDDTTNDPVWDQQDVDLGARTLGVDGERSSQAYNGPNLF